MFEFKYIAVNNVKVFHLISKLPQFNITYLFRVTFLPGIAVNTFFTLFLQISPGFFVAMYVLIDFSLTKFPKNSLHLERP